MTRPIVFIDGDAGTTGLRIRDALAARKDIELLQLPDAERKDAQARRSALNRADLVVLCLPDDAARQAASWIENPDTRVLDASSAHRLQGDWVYGLPELTADQREWIRAAPRVSNPGCYALGAILLLRPLLEAGFLSPDLPATIRGLSGYSGGGRSLIERWESPDRLLLGLPYPAPYALEVVHKHVPEMKRYSRLQSEPQFIPSVGPFRCGMRVEIALHRALLGEAVSAEALLEALTKRYENEPFVDVAPLEGATAGEEARWDPMAFNGTNRIELSVVSNAAGHVLLVARYDNLGKGACGTALQNLNLMLGFAEVHGAGGA
jgi:N-acetyl-gamma-glutamyl-phosphate reductase